MSSLLAVAEATLDNPLIEEGLRKFLLVLSVSLGVATLSRALSWLRNIPYTLLLLLVGLGLAILNVRLVNLSPELILFIFLPPLLFEAAWNIQWRNLKRDWLPIGLYAVVGVIICVGGLFFGLWGGGGYLRGHGPAGGGQPVGHRPRLRHSPVSRTGGR
jgi:CPA1 family monovalent cation:H+ antiporter